MLREQSPSHVRRCLLAALQSCSQVPASSPLSPARTLVPYPVRRYSRTVQFCFTATFIETCQHFKQRNETLINACNVWNYIDKSDRYRIKVNESKDTCPAIQVKDPDASAEEEEETEASGEEGDEKSDP